MSECMDLLWRLSLTQRGAERGRERCREVERHRGTHSLSLSLTYSHGVVVKVTKREPQQCGHGDSEGVEGSQVEAKVKMAHVGKARDDDH